MGKTYKKGPFVTYTVTADDDTAGTVDILITTSDRDDPAAFLVQVYRAGALVAEDVNVSYDKDTGYLTVADGVTFALTDGDIINAYFGFGEKQE